MVNVGDVAPDFKLTDQNGQSVSLSSFKGKKDVVLFFYPKDDTPGCTAECDLFDKAADEFSKLNAKILGVSSDEDHTEFVSKYGFQLTLLSDVGGNVRQTYKVPKAMMGFLDGRVTYIIGKDGKVKSVYENMMEPAKHVEEARKVLGQK